MAYESSTWTAVRREAGRAIGIARYGALTAVTTTTVTIPSLYLNTNRASVQANDETIISRPDATSAADNKRYIGSIATDTGAITVAGGANYADTTFTSEVGEEWKHNFDPYVDGLDEANEALKFVPVGQYFMLTSGGIPDLNYDCQESAATDFTDIGSPTKSVVTTVRRVRYGRRSVRCLCSGSSEGIQSATLPHVKRKPVKMFAFVSVDVGTCSVYRWDVTNTIAMGDPVVTGEEAMMLVELPWYTPDETTSPDCAEVALRFIGTGSSTADFYVNGCSIHEADNLYFDFPSVISERFKAPKIVSMQPRGSSSTANVYPASSIVPIELIEGQDYEFRTHHIDANPYGIVLLKESLLEWPIMVDAQVTAWDCGTFSTEASTTVAPFNQVVPAVALRWLDKIIIPRMGATEHWVGIRAIIQKDLDEAKKVRVPRQASQRRQWGGPSGGRI